MRWLRDPRQSQQQWREKMLVPIVVPVTEGRYYSTGARFRRRTACRAHMATRQNGTAVALPALTAVGWQIATNKTRWKKGLKRRRTEGCGLLAYFPWVFRCYHARTRSGARNNGPHTQASGFRPDCSKRLMPEAVTANATLGCCLFAIGCENTAIDRHG